MYGIGGYTSSSVNNLRLNFLNLKPLTHLFHCFLYLSNQAPQCTKEKVPHCYLRNLNTLLDILLMQSFNSYSITAIWISKYPTHLFLNFSETLPSDETLRWRLYSLEKCFFTQLRNLCIRSVTLFNIRKSIL
jgi:hypothetical protein